MMVLPHLAPLSLIAALAATPARAAGAEVPAPGGLMCALLEHPEKTEITDPRPKFSWPEAWDNKYKPNQDWNHAWGAAPANIIPRKLMGVEPIEPGFRKVRVRPQPGALERAALDVPTVRGPVHVDFKSSPSQFVMSVRLPANMTGQVCVPRRGRADDPTVVVDGVRRRGRVEGRFIVIEPVGSGTHRFRTQ